MSDKVYLDEVQLKKKTTRKKKPIQKFEKDFDIKKFKDRVYEQLANNVNINHDQTFNYTDYDKCYKDYLQRGFTNNTIVFINRLILESENLPNNIRTHYPLHKILFNITKTLIMNELEIVYLSLYLDKMGWITEGYSLEDNLLITGLSVKMYLNSNFEYITEHISKKKRNIQEMFNDWLNVKSNFRNQISIPPREVNERYRKLSIPFNSYCKTNYIDNNFIVDQILQMSLPYSDSRNQEEKHKNSISEYTMMNNVNSLNNQINFNDDNVIRDNVFRAINMKNENMSDIYSFYIKPKNENLKRNDSDLPISNLLRDNSMINQSNFQFFLSREPSMFQNNDENLEIKNLQFFPSVNIRNGILSQKIFDSEHDLINPNHSNEIKKVPNENKDKYSNNLTLSLPVNEKKLSNNFLKYKNIKTVKEENFNEEDISLNRIQSATSQFFKL